MRGKGFLTALAGTLACALCAGAQNLSIGTNMADYANFGTLNAEASLGMARHWSLNASARYNPFSFSGGSEGKGVQNRQQAYALGVRYWPWHIFSGWWISARAQYQEYNRGGIRSPETSEGDRYGTGLSAGYTYMLTPHLNMEIGAGVWGGYDRYVSYSCPRCGRVMGRGDRYFVMLNEVLLSLAYVF